MSNKFKSEGVWTRIGSAISMIVFTILGLYFIFFGNFKGVLVGISSVVLCFVWFSNHPYDVYFYDDHLIVKKRFKQIKVNYNQISFYFKNREGFAPIYIYVIKFEKTNGKKGKITFDANPKEAEWVLERINSVRSDIALWVKE